MANNYKPLLNIAPQSTHHYKKYFCASLPTLLPLPLVLLSHQHSKRLTIEPSLHHKGHIWIPKVITLSEVCVGAAILDWFPHYFSHSLLVFGCCLFLASEIGNASWELRMCASVNVSMLVPCQCQFVHFRTFLFCFIFKLIFSLHYLADC